MWKAHEDFRTDLCNRQSVWSESFRIVASPKKNGLCTKEGCSEYGHLIHVSPYTHTSFWLKGKSACTSIVFEDHIFWLICHLMHSWMLYRNRMNSRVVERTIVASWYYYDHERYFSHLGLHEYVHDWIGHKQRLCGPYPSRTNALGWRLPAHQADQRKCNHIFVSFSPTFFKYIFHYMHIYMHIYSAHILDNICVYLCISILIRIDSTC